MEPKSKRILSLSILAAIFLLAGACIFCYWFFIARHELSTKDAYVKGNVVNITSDISAPVIAIHVKETDLVHEGDPLITLDSNLAKANLEKSQAHLANTIRSYTKLKEEAQRAYLGLKQRQAQLWQAEFNFVHRNNLVQTGALSGEDIETSRTHFEVAQADFAMANSHYKEAIAQIEGTTVRTHPLVKEAKAALISAFLDLENSVIKSPVTGYVALRNTQLGETVSPEDQLLSVIPLYDIWVAANYKENKLKKVRLGQKVKLHADLYGKGVTFHGKVRGLIPGTGATFSLLPAQNATGNWIKILQRVPVIIDLDHCELKKHPLLVGLSMHSKIQLDETLPDFLPVVSEPSEELSTNIYADQIEAASCLIESIFAENYFPEKLLLTLCSDPWLQKWVKR